MASRTSIEKATKEITKRFEKASEKALALIVKKASSPKPFQEAEVALDILKIFQNLEKELIPLVEKDVREHYITSVNQASREVLKVAGTSTYTILTKQDYLNIEKQIRETLSDYGESIKGAFQSSLKVMNEARKLRIDTMFSAQGLTKLSREEIQKAIISDIAKDFTGIVDKSGRKWSLDTYAEMLTRTRMREISNDAMNARLQAEGYDLVQVSSHGADCDLCSDWEGEILSISGRNPNYPSVADAEADGLFHPNCKHRLLPYHPEIAEMSDD